MYDSFVNLLFCYSHLYVYILSVRILRGLNTPGVFFTPLLDKEDNFSDLLYAFIANHFPSEKDPTLKGKNLLSLCFSSRPLFRR